MAEAISSGPTLGKRVLDASPGKRVAELPATYLATFSYRQSCKHGPRSRRKRNVDASSIAKEAAGVRVTVGEESKVYPRLFPKEVHQFTKSRTVSTHTSEADTNIYVIKKFFLSPASIFHPCPQ